MQRKKSGVFVALTLALAFAGASSLLAIDREAQDREFLRALGAEEAGIAGSQHDGGEKAACNATANCGSTTVSCSGNNNCQAYDSNCSAGFRGYVLCDGQRTNCPACPGPNCGRDGLCNLNCFNIFDPDCICGPAIFCSDDSECSPFAVCHPTFSVCYCG